MPGTKKNTPACPAQWVAGSRRKLVRRNCTNGALPRSNTMPVLKPGSGAAGLASSVSNVGSEYVIERQSEDGYDQQQQEKRQQLEGSKRSMHSYPPSDAVKYVQPESQRKNAADMSRSGAPYTPFADAPATFSPKLTVTDGKKKQGLFGTKRPKALERPNSCPQTTVVTSPLPVTTPSKAAKFFGIEQKSMVTESPRRAHCQGGSIADDGAPVRPTLTKPYSLSLLTRSKTGTDRQTRFRQNVGLDEHKLTTTGKAGTTKGLRMLIPDFAGTQHAPIQQPTSTAARLALDERYDGIDLREPRFRIPAAPRPVPAAPKRRQRMRKKSPKPFERMSPITEASFEELRPVYRKGEDVAELGVISEYEYDDSTHSAPVLPRSHTESLLPSHNAFELDEDDLSPTDGFYDEAGDEEENPVHPGTRYDVKQGPSQQLTTLSVRSPLQSIEDDFLDATEDKMRLEARRMTIARVEAEKQAMDAETGVLRREHDLFKLDFKTGSGEECVCANLQHTPDENDLGDNQDLVSVSSSIDLDEEATVYQAKVMTLTRVTPGTVKLVTIPARQKKSVPHVGGTTPVFVEPTLNEHEKKSTVVLESSENALPASVSSSTTRISHIANKLKPIVTHYHHEDPDRTTKMKKTKMTRDESLLLVQNWVSDYNSTEQQPISTRVDPDVLADQETPPAPFPKSDEALPTPPIMPQLDPVKVPQQHPKHQCINNGHIFHPIDLRQIPDNAVVNSLEVRPYLQTYTGIKQHVKIPVLCEKCGEDCDENVWECEIAVCRMAVCQSCAEDMEAEWQERSVSEWKYG